MTRADALRNPGPEGLAYWPEYETWLNELSRVLAERSADRTLRWWVEIDDVLTKDADWYDYIKEQMQQQDKLRRDQLRAWCGLEPHP